MGLQSRPDSRDNRSGTGLESHPTFELVREFAIAEQEGQIPAMLVLIDNYDSFVHNLARYFRRLGQETVVMRNDAASPDEIFEKQPQAVVLSPGPCTPTEAGCSLDLVREAAGKIPILGVCLGHQVI